MATADVTLEQFETEVGEVKTALVGGDYATARKKAVLAEITFLALPQNTSMSGRAATHRSMLDRYKQLVDDYERAASGAGATQFVPVSFGRPY